MVSRYVFPTSLLALAAALALTGCNSQTGAVNDQAAANETAITNDADLDNGEGAIAPEDLPLPEGDTAVVEDASTAPQIQIVQVPAPAPTITAAEAEPLNDSIATERLIRAGHGITRVQQADGWAWMEDGHIIRTASKDGRRVSYFKQGSTSPYFIQQDGRSYSYSNGRVAHEYDEHGRPKTPNGQHQNDAKKLADDARRQHDRAKQASKTAPKINRSRDLTRGSKKASSPAPSRTSAANSGNDRNDSNGRNNNNDRNTGSGRNTGSDRSNSANHMETNPSDKGTSVPKAPAKGTTNVDRGSSHDRSATRPSSPSTPGGQADARHDRNAKIVPDRQNPRGTRDDRPSQ